MENKIQVAQKKQLFTVCENHTELETALAGQYSNDLRGNAIYRTKASDVYKDILPNVSIRDGYTRRDYEEFRLEEMIARDYRSMMSQCNLLYRSNGLAKNIVDLMGDFSCQGIRITHPTPRIQKFYQEWWYKVQGSFVSERFCNYLLRFGTNLVKRSTAKLRQKDIENLQRGFAKEGADIDVQPPPTVQRNEIPWKYNFINPLSIEVLGDELAMFVGEPTYGLNVPEKLIRRIKSPQNEIDKKIVDSMPRDIVSAILSGVKVIPLDKDKTGVYSYKKDDWAVFADPMLFSVLKDFQMLEKMKMADLAALDGAISHIRLWTLGSLEHKIIPQPEAISRLADILINNIGGGAMDLIWGPELSFKETSSDVYKFLGQDKYVPVLTAIYSGLGIPPTLTGSAANGGFTNNFISLKTLLERLNYVRMILVTFWENEISLVQRAMGFRFPAQLQFDRMVLSDEAAEKRLLIELADRGIISDETIRIRFGETPELEALRTRREDAARKAGKMPRKGGPWNNPEQKEALEKIALQSGIATPSEVGLELKEKKKGEKNAFDFKNEAAKEIAKQKKDEQPAGVPGQGRPVGQKDTNVRKQRRVLPRSAASFMETYARARTIQKAISDVTTQPYLDMCGKKNLRGLSDVEALEFEKFNFAILCNINLSQDVNHETILSMLENPLPIPDIAESVYKETIAKYVSKFGKEPTLSELRELQASVYALLNGDYDGEI